MGAWTSKIWTKAQSYANNPVLKGYSVEEIAYALYHQSYYKDVKEVKRFLQDPKEYDKPSIKGYFVTTYPTANNILGGYYTENACFSTPQASLLDSIFNRTRQLFTIAATGAGSPIVLDLDGDGVETTNVKDGSYFDHDGNGFAEQTGWAASDDGILVRDINGNGSIDNGKELFGDHTLLGDGTRASNGFQALADLDENADGKIDANDAAFSQLKVWKDIDGDGYSSTDELMSLSDAGVTSINTGYTDSTLVDDQGNEHRQVGNFTKTDGTTGAATDVWFKKDTAYTIANEWLELPIKERQSAISRRL